MAEHNELGKLGEELAVAFLQQNNYVILETRITSYNVCYTKLLRN